MHSTNQLFSNITSEGQLEFSLIKVDLPAPKAHEVIVRIEAAPINPSDMFPMFGPADLTQATLEYNDTKRQLTAPLYPGMTTRVSSRLDQVLPVGNEGAGVVVAAGESDAAQALMGKTVGILSGAAYSELCCVPVQACIVHKDGTTPAQAASSFINPLTALGR